MDIIFPLSVVYRNGSDFEHFMPTLRPFWDVVNLRFFKNQIEKRAD